MSHVSDEKGVGTLLEAFRLLPKDYQLDIYGAIKDKRYENYDWEKRHVSYKGEISSDEVLRKLNEYQLLVLPTSYREGYPGIIIEALSLGVPVVSTIVGGIPEIIQDGKTADWLNTLMRKQSLRQYCRLMKAVTLPIVRTPISHSANNLNQKKQTIASSH